VRDRRERADVIKLFSAHRVNIAVVRGQDFDLTTAQGRGMAGMLGEFDTMESEVKSERVASAAAQRAKKGRPNGDLGYGWRLVAPGQDPTQDPVPGMARPRMLEGATWVVWEPEATIVREITQRLLGGETIRGLTADLNERGIPAPKSGPWGKTTIRKLALRHSNVALRVHHRGRPDETLYDGAWPALVDRGDWERLRAALEDPARRGHSGPRPGRRKWLLTQGVGECAICGGPLRVAGKGRPPVHTYVCENIGCVGRRQDRVDALTREVVVAWLERPDALAWLADDEDAAKTLASDLAAKRAQRDQAVDAWLAGRLPQPAMERATSQLQPEIDELERAYTAALARASTGALADVAGPAAREAWDASNVAQRRAVLEELGLRVLIEKATWRGPGFDPRSVRFEWPWGTPAGQAATEED